MSIAPFGTPATGMIDPTAGVDFGGDTGAQSFLATILGQTTVPPASGNAADLPAPGAAAPAATGNPLGGLLDFWNGLGDMRWVVLGGLVLLVLFMMPHAFPLLAMAGLAAFVLIPGVPPLP